MQQGQTVTRQRHPAKSLTLTIIEALEKAGRDPTQSEQVLDDVVGMDALTQLSAPKVDGTSRVGGTVFFEYCTATIAGDPIRTPENRITTWITRNVTLESGATVGALMFTAGAAYATFLLSRRTASGFTRMPFVMHNVVAFTAIILGIQLVFGSFF